MFPALLCMYVCMYVCQKWRITIAIDKSSVAFLASSEIKTKQRKFAQSGHPACFSLYLHQCITESPKESQNVIHWTESGNAAEKLQFKNLSGQEAGWAVLRYGTDPQHTECRRADRQGGDIIKSRPPFGLIFFHCISS
jgi:hypothetical protein